MIRNDNSWFNLREATVGENCRNQGKRITNTSGFKGVTFRKDLNKWNSYTRLNNKRIHIGFHDTAQEAHAAYCEASERLHGEFSRTE
jgi:hypothetical protein